MHLPEIKSIIVLESGKYHCLKLWLSYFFLIILQPIDIEFGDKQFCNNMSNALPTKSSMHAIKKTGVDISGIMFTFIWIISGGGGGVYKKVFEKLERC